MRERESAVLRVEAEVEGRRGEPTWVTEREKERKEGKGGKKVSEENGLLICLLGSVIFCYTLCFILCYPLYLTLHRETHCIRATVGRRHVLQDVDLGCA